MYNYSYIKYNEKTRYWAKELSVSYLRIGNPEKSLWRNDINSQICTGITNGRIGRKAFHSGNPMGKDSWLEKFLVLPSYRENFNVVEASWQKEEAWDAMRWDQTRRDMTKISCGQKCLLLHYKCNRNLMKDFKYENGMTNFVWKDQSRCFADWRVGK